MCCCAVEGTVDELFVLPAWSTSIVVDGLMVCHLIRQCTSMAIDTCDTLGPWNGGEFCIRFKEFWIQC
jgi:hypothetical protein